MSLITPVNGTKLICPVCNKEFSASDNTRYIINNGWTCSWKCFKNEHIKQNQEKWDKQKSEKLAINSGVHKRKGRKRKSKDEKVDSTYNKIKDAIINKKEESLEQEDINKVIKDTFK